MAESMMTPNKPEPATVSVGTEIVPRSYIDFLLSRPIRRPSPKSESFYERYPYLREADARFNLVVDLQLDMLKQYHAKGFAKVGVEAWSATTMASGGSLFFFLKKKEKNKLCVEMALTRIGLAGLAVMGQNLALNIAEKGFPISVYNRTTSKVDETVQRAKAEGNLPVYGFHDPASFVNSIQKPRVVIMLVKAGAPVDQTIATLAAHLEQGDCIIDGGNEWYENTERREKAMEERGLLYLGMGVSGGEEGARNGPSLMPGGSFEAYKYIEDIVLKVAAQVPDSGPCVTYVGKGGSGNFVKMVHNGIEYGDMQLIAEAYDVLKSVGKLTNSELHQVFSEWNKGELLSFLIEITADIFSIKDDQGDGYLVDKVLDKTGMKGTGKWTVQQAAELSVAAPTIEASLDSRFLSGLKDERVEASKIFQGDYSTGLPVDKAQLIEDVRQALYASKICSYAQGMNIIKAKSSEKGWDLNLGELARIWKGGCIIRAIFLDRIKKAYDRNPNLANLLVDPEFAHEIMDRQAAWRRVVCLAIDNGVSTPGMSASLAYFDSYRRDRLPANLVQAQRDYFGAHTYERVDMPVRVRDPPRRRAAVGVRAVLEEQQQWGNGGDDAVEDLGEALAKTRELVECAMFAAVAGLAYFLSNSLAIELMHGVVGLIMGTVWRSVPWELVAMC
nr:unnamed protein product [Digitaria exilis]